MLDPCDFLNSLYYFNKSRVEAEKNACRGFKIDWGLYDVTDFFPKACRKKASRALKKVIKKLKRKIPGKDFFCVSREPGKRNLDPGSAKGRWRQRNLRKTTAMYLSKKVTRREYGMRLDLMCDAVSLDFEFGLVFVLRKAMIAEKGYNIGSPWAAVGAALGGAVDEEDLKEEFTKEERDVIERCVFDKRWQDDKIFIYFRREFWPEVDRYLTRAQDAGFFGGELLQGRESTNEPFGFMLYKQSDQKVIVTCKNKFSRIVDEGMWVAKPKVNSMNTGATFGPPKLVEAEAVGLTLRIIDWTNAPKALVYRQLVRLFCEMRLQSLPRRVIRRCMDVVVSATGQFADIYEVLYMDPWDLVTICENFDKLVFQNDGWMIAKAAVAWEARDNAA